MPQASSPSRKRRDNHEAIMAILRKASRPKTAYEILDCLRPMGISSPPTVYRLLDRLLTEGRIHRLESLNAFVQCSHPHHDRMAVFTICDSCGCVSEIQDEGLIKRIVQTAKRQGFDTDQALLEMRGKCQDCSARKKSMPAAMLPTLATHLAKRKKSNTS